MSLETEQKALEINLDPTIYGTFAEIGAGQEVARHFFQAGGAAGTIAKTMSAYDKTVSDAIYGIEPSGRYVCETRLYKMLEYEYNLMWERLKPSKMEAKLFVFANTVSAINYKKTNSGSGWLGVRFQRSSDGAMNDLVVHVRLLDPDNRLQQQAIGILGVNMVYAAFRKQSQPEEMVKSLHDNLHGRVAIDMVSLRGADFEDVDNRLLSLYLVKHGLSEVAIFGNDGRSVHASEFLYRKSILIARGSFRPPTKVVQDMIQHGFEQFNRDANESNRDVSESNRGTYFLCEITLDNLMADGSIDEADFLDRAEMLCALGQTVVISNCMQHKKLIAYFSEYKVGQIGLVMGVRKLSNIISETYAQNGDNLLAAFGHIFLRNVRFYIYPTLINEEIKTIDNIDIPPAIIFLYKHLVETRHIVNVERYRRETLHIHHKETLAMIQTNEAGWEEMVPRRIAKLIKEKGLFGYRKT